MALCHLCRELGNWLLSELEESSDRYAHHESWKQLEASAKKGCPFCCHIVAFFNDRGSHRGFYEHNIVPDVHPDQEGKTWVEQIAELQEKSQSTQIQILKGGHRETAHLLYIACDQIGIHNGELEVYVSAGGSPSTFHTFRVLMVLDRR